MRKTAILSFIAMVAGILLLHGASAAQIETDIGAGMRVDFTLVYDSMDLALETWQQSEPPDSVKLEAYRVASGFLSGITFHYERNRDRLMIHEQVESVPDEMEFQGMTLSADDVYCFDYAIWVPEDHYADACSGQSYQGHGASELERTGQARREARREAFEHVIRQALRSEYTEQNEQIPGTVDGKLIWYEIQRDERDFESGFYVFDITAWVTIPED